MAHVHAGDVNGVGDSKEDGYANNLHLPSTLHKNGSGKVHGHGDIMHVNADAGEHIGVQRQRRAKSKGKKKKNGNSGRSNDDGDDDQIAIPLTFRLKNLSDDVDMDRLKSALRDLVEKTANNLAECNTEGGEDSIMVELVDDEDENNQDIFDRKLTLAGWQEMIQMALYINCRHNMPLRDCAIRLSLAYPDLIRELLQYALLWNDLIW